MEVVGAEDVAGAVEVDDAGGSMNDCSSVTFSKAVECLVISIS